MELHNDISINSSSSHKIPKKIDYWYFEKSEREFREQINYLKAEIKQKDEIIHSLTIGNTQIKEVVEPKEYKAVGKHNPARVLAQMEALDRKNYWEAEIARRDRLAETEGNVSEINETKQ